MKTSHLLACCLAAVLGVLPPAAKAQDPAAPQEVSFDFFYNSLSDDGAWYNTPEYGYVFQPDIGYKNDKWRPYTDGYWAQTQDGWTWVSYESFGWATYHYGRWTRLQDLGWAWVPGYDWGPGWVSWRTSDERVGWAPLPPKRERVVYEGKIANNEPPAGGSVSINYNDVEESEGSGYTPAVDEQYDIGPQNYCFVESRNFGAPVLSEVILPPQQNFVYVQDTVNVTNITYRRDPGFGGRTVVYNNGPDYAFLSQRSERPIQQLQLQRRDDPAYVRDGIRGGNNPTLVRNGVLLVASPVVSRNAVNLEQVRPPRVKENLARAEVVRGWQGVSANQQQVAQLHERIKENARTAPPVATANQESFRRSPAAQVAPLPPAQQLVGQSPGRAERAANQPSGLPANAGRQAGTGPRGDLSDADRAARRDARLQERQQRDTARASGQPIPLQPGANPAAGTPQNAQDRAARQQQRPQTASGAVQASVTPAAPGQPAAGGKTREERRAAKQQPREQQTPAVGSQPGQPANAPQPATASQPAAEQQAQERRAQRQQQKQAAQQQQQAAPTQAAPQSAPSQEERQQRRQERQQQQQAAPQPNPAAEQEKQQRRQERQQQQAAPQAPQPNPAAEQEKQQRRQERQQQQQQAPQSNPAAEQERQQRRPERQQQQQAAPQAQQERQERRPERQQQQQQAAPQERQERRQERQQQAAQPNSKGENDDKKKPDRPN